MLFSSMTFIGMFLPIVCATYLLAKRDIKNYILLVASILFYAWGEPRYLAIMILTILVNYFGAIYIDRYKAHKKQILITTILTNLGFLFYFKYFNFMIDNVNSVFAANFEFLDIVMPIGISFYTFQALSYVIDVYRGDAKVQKDVYKLALYISLFPQLIAGPIVKYHDIETQIDKREVTLDKVSYGVKRFIIGLSKKILIANTLGAVADKIFALPPDQFDVATAWLGAICYSLQLYYDFSGYSDMAIGLGAIFGFKFLENFNYPYISKSITEFWRRWHISLSTWFKEYLYIPLGGNRKGAKRTYVNLFLVFLATGIWHGAQWSFVVWGLWHGLFIIIEKMSGWAKESSSLRLNITKHVYTILVFIIGWVLFRAETLGYGFDYLQNMFGLLENHKVMFEMGYYLNNFDVIILIVGIFLSTPIFRNILYVDYKHKVTRAMINIWLMTVFIVSVSFIASSTYNPFIYFRF